MLDPDSYSVHSRELSRPVGNAGTATPVQSDSILLQDFLGGGGGLCAQLAIRGGGSGSWFSESVAQQIKETDNTDRH